MNTKGDVGLSSNSSGIVPTLTEERVINDGPNRKFQVVFARNPA